MCKKSPASAGLFRLFTAESAKYAEDLLIGSSAIG
jgi:hypothetical protein